jgi:hypothetical protein
VKAIMWYLLGSCTASVLVAVWMTVRSRIQEADGLAKGSGKSYL